MGSNQNAGAERAALTLDVGEVLVAEVLQRTLHRARGTVAESAERATENVVGGEIRTLIEPRYLWCLRQSAGGNHEAPRADVELRATNLPAQ